MSGTLTIRADCSPTMGTGHVMRMIALGQAWQELGGTVQFVGDFGPLKQRLESEGFSTHPVPAVHPDPRDMEWLLELTNPGDWVAIDGYHFDTEYQKTVRKAGRKTLVKDDINDRGEYNTDILLNQNPGSDAYDYNTNPDASFLLGAEYTLLRREFKDYPKNNTPIPGKATNILVTLGGADPAGLTSVVLDALSALDDTTLHVKIVAGAANPDIATIREKSGTLPCRHELLFGVEDMAPLMAWAHVAVTASGATCWELCHFGVPMIAIRTADNQTGVHNFLKRAGVSTCLDRDTPVRDIIAAIQTLLPARAKRCVMAESGQALIDGRGAWRVACAIYQTNIRLRPATMEDCRLLFDWRNHPSVRVRFFNTEPLEYSCHERWFKGKLADDSCLLFIAENENNNRVGQLRFDRDGNEATVSITTAPEMTGRGIGTAMMCQGCAELDAQWPGVKAVALVKKDNFASAAMFRKAGFTQTASSKMEQLRFEWSM